MHDVCVVASEERIEQRREEKIAKYSPLVDELKRKNHDATIYAIAVGSRVSIVNTDEIMSLECDNPLALRKRIWHSTIRSLRSIHLAYKRAQTVPSQPSSNPAIPRDKRVPRAAP